MKTSTKKIIISILANFILCFTASAINDALKVKVLRTTTSTDETVIRFLPTATDNFDGNFDAYKMFSTNTSAPSIYTNIDSVTHMSINALPSLASLKNVELFIKIKVAGLYTIQSIELGTGFAPSVQITLEDKETGLLYNFRNGKSISVMMNVTTSNTENRFTVHFSPEMNIVANNVSCNGLTDGSLTINKTGNQNWDYQLKNNFTAQIFSGNNINETVTISNLVSGNYTLYTESSSNLMDSTIVTIAEPAAIVAQFTADNLNVYLSAATIAFTNNSLNSTSYSWDFGDGDVSDSISPVHQYHSTGNYNVTLTAQNTNGCLSTYVQTIHVNEDLLPLTFNQTNASCYGSRDGMLVISKPGNHNWNYELRSNSSGSIFGNNADVTATISNLSAGIYILYTQSTFGVADTASVTIAEPLAVVANFTSDKENVFLSDATITFTNASSSAVSYSWDFGDGDVSDSVSSVHQYSAAGSYMVILTAENENGCNSSFSKLITVNAELTTGINDHAQTSSDLTAQQIDGELQLDLHLASSVSVVINVYNSFGQLIYNYADDHSGSFSKRLPINVTGTYIVNSIINNTSNSKKITLLK